MKNEKLHEPVMVQEVLAAFGFDLAVKKAHLNFQGRFIDATLGSGGHALEIIKNKGQVLGIEWDTNMLRIAEKRLKEACPPSLLRKAGLYTLVQGNFKDIKDIAERENFQEVDGILFDLGVSNIQLTSPIRGFSFLNPQAKLDMRINPDIGPTASDLLNVLRPDQLKSLFLKVLKRTETTKLIREIINFKSIKKFEKVADFLEVCSVVFRKTGKIHPATRALLALRMAVNSELENLKEGLSGAFRLLKKTGRIAVISFHSGEDAVVKKFFKERVNKKEAILINNEPLIPKAVEINKNPKARSAKLRIIEKV